MNVQNKRWCFTWGTTSNQKKLPNEVKLLNFLNRNTDTCVFQYELGSVKKKEHVQGMFTLTGPRQSKTSVLNLFKLSKFNVEGLTLSPEFDKVASYAYCTKPEGRTKGPFYGGQTEMYDTKVAASVQLNQWQKELFCEITGPEQKSLKDRKVIWVQDCCGNTGKSYFQKWLRIAQKELVVRLLPIQRVDRLISAVNIISKTTNVDAYLIDLTRTQGEDQSYKDLFSAIEQIKNGHIVDVMYGKYNEAIFDPPMVIIFTNEKIDNYRQYLSLDRWRVYLIGSGHELSLEVPENPGQWNRVSDLKPETVREVKKEKKRFREQ